MIAVGDAEEIELWKIHPTPQVTYSLREEMAISTINSSESRIVLFQDSMIMGLENSDFTFSGFSEFMVLIFYGPMIQMFCDF